MDTVYATQIPMRRDPSGQVERAHDLSPALDFGDVVQLLPPGPTILETQTAMRTLRTKLSTFCDSDYLLCLGDPSAMVAAAMVASSMNGGRVKLLVYDRHDRKYMPVQLDLHQKG